MKLILHTYHLENVKPNNISLLNGKGPSWLKDPHEYNKYMNFICKDTNEEDIEKKKKLKSVKLLMNVDENLENSWYYRYFSRLVHCN